MDDSPATDGPDDASGPACRPAPELTGGRPDEDGDLFRATDPILVRQPITGSVDVVRSQLADLVDAGDVAATPDVGLPDAGLPDAGRPDALLPDAGVATCSVFLEAGADDPAGGDDPAVSAVPAGSEDPTVGRPTLTWYLEVPPDSSGWASPAARLLAVSPLFADEAVRDAVDHGNAQVFSAAEAFVHARLPERPGTPDPVEVVLVRVPFEPGLPSLAMRGLAGLVRALRGTWVEDRMEAESREVLVEEGMWTETLWLVADGRDSAGRSGPRTSAGAGLLWYMEAEEMERVMDAYEDSETFVARASEWLAERVLAEPLSALGDPAAASDFELLVHLTDPDRP